MELEPERALEAAQEQIAENVEELRKEIATQQAEESKERHWISQVALSTGIISALAAIAAMQGNFLANEGTIAQIRANDLWTQFQSKSTKGHIERSTVSLLNALQKPVPPEIAQEVTKLDREKQEIQVEAQREEIKAREAIEKHEYFAYSVAALQVAISLGAVAALLRRRSIWYFGLGIAALGVGFIAWGFAPAHQATAKAGEAKNIVNFHIVKGDRF